VRIAIIENCRFKFRFIVFNATFSNISAIPWRPTLVVEEVGVPGENHQPWTSRVHPFSNLQSRAQTHAVLVIGLYELLGNPTTYLIEPLGHSVLHV
jgi:hypothetical protein